MLLASCGDDNDEPTANDPISGFQESDLLGYWYNGENADDKDFEALYIQPNGIVTSLYGELGNPSENDEYTALWNTQQIDGMVIISVNYNTLILDEDGDGSDIIVYTKINATQWSNLRRTATLDGSGGTTPDNPSTSTWSESDFIGVWLRWTGGAVYELKANHTMVCYYLTQSGANTYNETVSGTWSYYSSSSELYIYRSDGSAQVIETITNVNPYQSFRTTDGTWIATQIPTPQNNNNSADNSLLEGTKWQGRVDGEVVTIEFKTNGKFTEKFGSDLSTDTYMVLDSNTLLIGENTVMANTFGSIVDFSLNSNKTKITFSNYFEKWELSRIM